NRSAVMVRRPRFNLARRHPGGVTLLELLIVLAILLIVTAAAIPLMVPATQNRRMREAARLVSSYFAGARARAIENNRPVGVIMRRFDGNPFSMNLAYVEVPPPYSGDFQGATCNVALGGPSFSDSAANVPAGYSATWFTLTLMTATFNSSLIRV